VDVLGSDTVYENGELQPIVINTLVYPDIFGELGVFWKVPDLTVLARGR
jgi:hypothetical protein